eukprot:scaffold384_cov238-Pinguiococcus_pyrenoidosus.AAC.5
MQLCRLSGAQKSEEDQLGRSSEFGPELQSSVPEEALRQLPCSASPRYMTRKQRKTLGRRRSAEDTGLEVMGRSVRMASWVVPDPTCASAPPWCVRCLEQLVARYGCGIASARSGSRNPTRQTVCLYVLREASDPSLSWLALLPLRSPICFRPPRRSVHNAELDANLPQYIP